jgi:hypothetical protein
MTWNGRHGKGAMRRHRDQKRVEAKLRQAAYIERAGAAKAAPVEEF